MKLLKSHSILSLGNSYLIDSPSPSNLSYLWNYGSLLGTCLVIQIITGVTLAMHYCGSTDLAFLSVEHIMRDVNFGWLIRYLHANVASFFFFFVYLHIGKGLYYGSYKAPRTMLWSVGVIIFLVMMGTGFIGYVLVWGQPTQSVIPLNAIACYLLVIVVFTPFVVSRVLSTILRRTLIAGKFSDSPQNPDDTKVEFRDGRPPIYIPKSQFPSWVSPWLSFFLFY